MNEATQQSPRKDATAAATTRRLESKSIVEQKRPRADERARERQIMRATRRLHIRAGQRPANPDDYDGENRALCVYIDVYYT